MVIIERNEPFLMERFQELYDEEGIPIRLTLEELGERSCLAEVVVQCCLHHGGQVLKL
jgi:hypothetical protein